MPTAEQNHAEQPEMQPITLNLPPDTMDQLAKVCEEEELTLEEFIQQALQCQRSYSSSQRAQDHLKDQIAKDGMRFVEHFIFGQCAIALDEEDQVNLYVLTIPEQPNPKADCWELSLADAMHFYSLAQMIYEESTPGDA